MSVIFRMNNADKSNSKNNICDLWKKCSVQISNKRILFKDLINAYRQNSRILKVPEGIVSIRSKRFN